MASIICVKVFKNGLSKIRRRQPLKILKWYHFKFFEGCLPQILFGPFLNTLTHLQHYKIAMKILICLSYKQGIKHSIVMRWTHENDRNAIIICTFYLKLTINTSEWSQSFWCLYSKLWTYFTLFWLSVVDFEQVYSLLDSPK